jgi:hypothetical protein
MNAKEAKAKTFIAIEKIIQKQNHEIHKSIEESINQGHFKLAYCNFVFEDVIEILESEGYTVHKISILNNTYTLTVCW